MHKNLKGKACKFGFNVAKNKDENQNQLFTIPLKKNFCLNHNDYGLLSDQFKHKVLSQDVLDDIEILSESGINPMKTATVIRTKYQIELATQQIAQITGVSKNDCGPKDLIDYIESINGFHLELEEIKEGKLYRIAVATFTLQEVQNLKKMGTLLPSIQHSAWSIMSGLSFI